LRVEDLSCSLDVLYGGLGIRKWQFKKKEDPDMDSMNPDPQRCREPPTNVSVFGGKPTWFCSFSKKFENTILGSAPVTIVGSCSKSLIILHVKKYHFVTF
jgi:hypothetical protein